MSARSTRSPKVVLVGDAAVGKTSILASMRKLPFDRDVRATSGPATLKIPVGGIDIEFWDTAGQDSFASLVPQYVRGARAVIFVYALNERASFEDVSQWLNFVTEKETVRCIFLVGNKSDLNREVSFDEAVAWADEHNAEYCETSAATGACVQDLLDLVAKSIRTLPEAREENDLVIDNRFQTRSECC
jgi:small GTP-binding protein